MAMADDTKRVSRLSLRSQRIPSLWGKASQKFDRLDEPLSPTSTASTRTPSDLGDSTLAKRKASVEGLTIFDWDDTLFPTTSIRSAEAVFELGDILRLHGQRLAKHARVLEQILRTAAALGPVCIVTLANRGWVEHAASQYLPQLRLKELLMELSIPVYYAQTFAHKKIDLSDFNVQTMLKTETMLNAVTDICESFEIYLDDTIEVLSIGDSLVERTAVKRLPFQWASTGIASLPPRVKTLKLLDRPQISVLTSELESLTPCLSTLHSSQTSHEIEPMQLAELQAGLKALCAQKSPSDSAILWQRF